MISKDSKWFVYVDSENIGVFSPEIVERLIASGILKEQDHVAPKSNPQDVRPISETFAGVKQAPTMGDESLFTHSFLPFKTKHHWYINTHGSFEGPHVLTVGQIVDLVRSGALSQEAKLWHRGLLTIDDAHWIAHPYVERKLYDREKYAVEIPAAPSNRMNLAGTERLEVQLGSLDFGPLTPSEIRQMLGYGQLLHSDRVRPVEAGAIEWREAPTLGDVFGDIPPSSTTDVDEDTPVPSLPFVTQQDWIISHGGHGSSPVTMTVGELVARIRYGLIPHDASIHRPGAPDAKLSPPQLASYGHERQLYDKEFRPVQYMIMSHVHYRRPKNEAEDKRIADDIRDRRRREREREAEMDDYWGKAKQIVSEGRWRFDFRA